MSLKIRLFGSLVKYSPSGEDSFEMKVQRPITVRELLETIKIPKHEVWMVTINGNQSDPGELVKGNDEVMIFEPVLGG